MSLLNLGKDIDLAHPLIFRQLIAVGLHPEAIKNMPAEYKKALASGSLTPPLMMAVDCPDGSKLKMPVRLMIDLNNASQPELLIYGISKKLVNEQNFSDEILLNLKKGNVYLYADADGVKRFAQYDPETNDIIYMKYSAVKIDDKIADVEKIRDIELGNEQKKAIRDGKPVTLNVGDEEVTVGVDLRAPNHFKQLKGDMEDWKLQKEIEYDIAHPEYVGIVQTDENRWEYFNFVNKGPEAPELKQKPKQTKSAGFKL